MNSRTAVRPVVDADATVERFDAIAHSVDASFGVVSGDHDLDQLVAAIRAVSEGGSLIDPKVVEGLVADRARAATSPLSQLTARERDVLRKMAEGRNNASIAEDLVMAERSVEKVIHSIFMKLGLTWEPAVHKRVKAVILYLAESDLGHRDNGSQP